MSDYEDTSSEVDQTTYSLDDEDQLQPQDTLVDRGVADQLDEGYSPADHAPLGYGTNADQRDETIEQRIREEVPDPTSAYGAPDNESGLDDPPIGGADPDSIASDQDFLGEPQVGAERAGRLVAPDAGLAEDRDAELFAGDVGIDGAGASAEEAAVHVIDQE